MHRGKRSPYAKRGVALFLCKGLGRPRNGWSWLHAVLQQSVRSQRNTTLPMKRLLPFLLLLLFGCAASKITETMDSWLNHSKTELYATWGAPSRTISDGALGEILVYEEGRNYMVPNPGRIGSGGSSTSTTTYQRVAYTRTYQFFVNERGRIYRWVVRNQ